MKIALSGLLLAATFVFGILPAMFLLFLGIVILGTGIVGLINGEYWQGFVAISHWLASLVGVIGLWLVAFGIEKLITLVMLLIGVVMLSSFAVPILINSFDLRSSLFLWAPLVVGIFHTIRVAKQLLINRFP